jgi:hypothetical protein
MEFSVAISKKYLLETESQQDFREYVEIEVRG